MSQPAAHRRASSEKTRPSVFWLLAVILVPILGLFARIRIVGGENLPRDGAFVLAPNHHSEFDPLIVASAVWRLGRAPRFMAKEGLFRVPVVGAVLRAAGMVPVARSSSASAAWQTLETSRQLVEHGRGVIVYPEGTLTRDPDLWPMRGKTGAVRLALSDGIPLIPLAQWGVQEIMPRYGRIRFPRRQLVTVVIGEPVDLSDLVAEKGSPATLVRGTTRLMDDIAALLGGIRRAQPPAERWDPAVHDQKETGRFEP